MVWGGVKYNDGNKIIRRFKMKEFKNKFSVILD